MKRRFVILNEVKNLIGSMSSVGEILRLHLRMTLRHSLSAGIDMSFAKKEHANGLFVTPTCSESFFRKMPDKFTRLWRRHRRPGPA